MLTYRPPFSGDSELEVMEKILKFEPSYQLYSLKNVSAECLDFMKKLLSKNPANRPSAYEAYKHPWIQKYVATRSEEFKSKTQTLENLATFKVTLDIFSFKINYKLLFIHTLYLKFCLQMKKMS